MTIEYHTKAYVCSHVFDGSRPVLLVAHEDGDWQLLCGGGHDFPAELPKVVGIGHLLDRDPSIALVLDMLDGFEAERGRPGAQWERRAIASPT